MQKILLFFIVVLMLVILSFFVPVTKHRTIPCLKLSATDKEESDCLLYPRVYQTTLALFDEIKAADPQVLGKLCQRAAPGNITGENIHELEIEIEFMLSDFVYAAHRLKEYCKVYPKEELEKIKGWNPERVYDLVSQIDTWFELFPMAEERLTELKNKGAKTSVSLGETSRIRLKIEEEEREKSGNAPNPSNTPQ